MLHSLMSLSPSVPEATGAEVKRLSPQQAQAVFEENNANVDQILDTQVIGKEETANAACR